MSCVENVKCKLEYKILSLKLSLLSSVNITILNQHNLLEDKLRVQITLINSYVAIFFYMNSVGALIPQRVILSIMGFFALAVANTMRSCLSIAITEMVAPTNKTGKG